MGLNQLWFLPWDWVYLPWAYFCEYLNNIECLLARQTAWCISASQKFLVAALEPHSGIAWAETPPSGQGFEPCTWLFALPGRRGGQWFPATAIPWQWVVGLASGQGLGTNEVGTLVTRGSGIRDMWTELSEWAQNMNVFVPMWMLAKE